jgi:ABC-2 type transport system permease protein
MKHVVSLTKREIKEYFHSPAAYVFIVIFLLLSGFFTFMFSGFFEQGEARLIGFFTWHPWLYLFLVPAAGMHLWADERRLGTLELLFTMPVTLAETILSKFLAAWIYIGIALALTFPIVWTVNYLGNPDNGVIVCEYIGSFLVAGTFLAVGCWTSALTRSQVVSFILSLVVCLFLIISGWPPVTNLLVEWAPRWLIDAVAELSVIPHYENLERGVLDSRDIVYYLSSIVFSLFLTGIVLKSHRAG